MGRVQTLTSALNHALPWTQRLPRPPQVSRDISHMAQWYPWPASYRQGLAEHLCRLVLELVSCEEGGRYQCSLGGAPLPSHGLALLVSSPRNNQTQKKWQVLKAKTWTRKKTGGKGQLVTIPFDILLLLCCDCQGSSRSRNTIPCVFLAVPTPRLVPKVCNSIKQATIAPLAWLSG